ncbi:hypothetical protein P154DRAFT_261540 [Amniculicola lignicola CBS 123094]|uniref:Uncharacterized protein n=1 Tax=Amniculicola lignicola CBS 123094 TaxID=1392246 RepID=A0A6A5WAV7_9PLEO|nr:hypothetical protein P154DRAFT_261540 [Amniculicola lignicola CBS 123094]
MAWRGMVFGAGMHWSGLGGLYLYTWGVGYGLEIFRHQVLHLGLNMNERGDSYL